MLWACIVLPQLALDAVLRRLSDPDAPLALVGGAVQLRTLHAVNAAAAQAGLQAGMRLTAALALLPAEARPLLTHQTGDKNFDAVQQAYAAAGLKVGRDVTLLPFIDNMAALLADCDVILCRAGAITISELCAAGVPSILVPLVVSTTSHQRDNAAWMAQHGAALHLPQAELNADPGFVELDKDMDGFIDKAEVPAEHSLALEFAAADSNRDSRLDRIELETARVQRRGIGVLASIGAVALPDNQGKAPGTLLAAGNGLTLRLPDGRILKGAANLGIRPSFDPPKELLEPHFFDFDGEVDVALLDIFTWFQLAARRVVALAFLFFVHAVHHIGHPADAAQPQQSQ